MAAKILILDDNFEDAESIQKDLNDIGYHQTKTVHAGQEFISEVENNHYDLAIVDIDLGGKMTGIDWANKINLKTHLPFILLSSLWDEEYVQSSTQIGAKDYLVKGVSQQQLSISIQRALFSAKNEFVEINNENRHILKHDIYCIASFGHHKIIYFLSDQRPIFLTESFDSLIDRINHPPLMRVHTSYYVNLDHVSAYTRQQITLPKPIVRNGDPTPIHTINIGINSRPAVRAYLSKKN